MGISLESWRARIGCFCPTRKNRSTSSVSWTVSSITSRISLCIRITLFLLLVVQGVESNPGPGSGSRRGNNGTKETRSIEPSKGKNPTAGSSKGARNKESALNNHPEINSSQSSSQMQTRRSKAGAKEQGKISQFLYREDKSKKKSQTSRQSEIDQYNSDNEYETTQDEIYDDSRSSSESESDTEFDMKAVMMEIRKGVKRTNRKLDRLEGRVDRLTRENEKLKRENKTMSDKIDEMGRSLTRLEEKSSENEKKNEQLEAQSRRDNLKFFNIKENGHNESWEKSETKIRQYLINELDMDPNNIGIERAHRLHSKTTPRPIIVKFSSFKTKDTILRKYREKAKEDRERREQQDDDQYGQNNQIRVSEDFVKRVADVRAKLLPFMKEHISNGHKATLRYDKLIVEGIPHVFDYNTNRPVPV